MTDQPFPAASLNDYPTADDPYGTQPAEGEFAEQEAEVRRLREKDPDGNKYPSYEVNQDPEDHTSGGSTDPHNFMTHANSGDETEDLDDQGSNNERQ